MITSTILRSAFEAFYLEYPDEKGLTSHKLEWVASWINEEMSK